MFDLAFKFLKTFVGILILCFITILCAYAFVWWVTILLALFGIFSSIFIAIFVIAFIGSILVLLINYLESGKC